jgi:mono/diheme cytochrome c family protein
VEAPSPLKALGSAAVAAVLASALALALGAALRRHAARSPFRQAAGERLFEPGTPTSPELVARGRSLFLGSCAHCHGADASGDEGPDLHDEQVSDRYIARVITRGIPHEMPSFAKKHGAADIRALTAYVRSLEGARGS